MLTCPMCKRTLRGLERECPSCRTDVSLLVTYVENLRDGLSQAEALTRQGELGEAVWAYLSVLEVDPDNATARRQVGKVATAVRQFDRTSPGRRWLKQLRSKNRLRRWMATWSEDPDSSGLLSNLLWFLVVFGALMVGYVAGWRSLTQTSSEPAPTLEPPSDTKPSEPEKKPAGKEKPPEKPEKKRS